MKRLAPILLFLVCACESEGEKAEDRYKLVDAQAIDNEERCAAAREVARAYLDDRNAEKYALWKNSADVKCQAVDLERRDLVPG